MLWCSRISAISIMRVERNRMRSEVIAMKAIACMPMKRNASLGA